VSDTTTGTSETIHASCVAHSGRAVLILGKSGAGKSCLALDLMSRGAMLVSDDQTRLRSLDGILIASAPKVIRGKIEARGFGLLAAECAGPTPVVLAVDLTQKTPARLPEQRFITIAGVEIDLIYTAGLCNVAPAILQYLKGGRAD
jgi:serine kinase of HPr protein (carbohydrate metabolism regulator)